MCTTRFCVSRWVWFKGVWSQGGGMVPGEGVWSQGAYSPRRHGSRRGAQIDRHLWKHYLPATSLAGGNKCCEVTSAINLYSLLLSTSRWLQTTPRSRPSEDSRTDHPGTQQSRSFTQKILDNLLLQPWSFFVIYQYLEMTSVLLRYRSRLFSLPEV